MDNQIANKILEETRKSYDLIFEKFSGTRTYPWKEFDEFKKYITSGMKILDVGCGNGRLLETLKDKNIEYTGVDFSINLIEKAKQRYPQANFSVAEITNLPYENESFDSVFAIAVFHHIPSKDYRQKALSELHRILKNKGILILTNWNLWQRHWRGLLFQYTKAKILGKSDLDFFDIYKPWKNEQSEIVTKRYCHAYTKNELKKLLESPGFKILEQYYSKKGQPANWLTGYNLVTIAQKNNIPEFSP